MSILEKGYGLLPNEIIYNEELSSSAKVFFACVVSHSAERGYSFATNGYFAKKMKVNLRQIQRWLEELSGYLYVYQENGQRRIMPFPGDMDTWGVTKKTWGVTKKTWGGDKKDTHNNINLIIKKNIKKAPEEDLELNDLFFSLVHELGFDRTKVKMLPERKKKLLLRMKLYTASDLIKAAKSIRANEYMQGKNDGNVRYGTIEYLIRNDNNVEKWLLRSSAEQSGPTDIQKAEWERQEEANRRFREEGKAPNDN